MKLETLINEHFDHLNANDKQIITYIVQHQETLRYASSEAFAAACHISRATLLRLCRKIGLHSFADLKYLLKAETLEHSPIPNLFDICENYHSLLDELKKISFHDVCKRLYEANTIYIYGTGNEQKNLTQEIKRIFLSVGKCVIDCFDYGEVQFIVPSLQPNDVFFIISLSGETQEGIDIIKSIKDHIHTISLTRLQNNTISSLCEHHLYVATQLLEGLQVSSYELVGVFYALVDLLFIKYLEYRGERL